MEIFTKLAWIFFKIGILTVGGGLAMIPIIQHEMLRLGWMDNQQFLDILGVSQMTPGPISVNTATFVGFRLTTLEHPGCFWLAILGALVGTFSVSAPSLICVNIFGAFWHRHRKHPCVEHIFTVLRPMVTGLVVTATTLLVTSALWERFPRTFAEAAPDYVSLSIVICAFSLTAFTKFSPVYTLLGGAIVGLLCG